MNEYFYLPLGSDFIFFEQEHDSYLYLWFSVRYHFHFFDEKHVPNTFQYSYSKIKQFLVLPVISILNSYNYSYWIILYTNVTDKES